MKRLLLFIYIAYTTPVFAHSSAEYSFSDLNDSIQDRKHSIHDSIRSKFVKRFPDHFFVWPVIKRRSLEVEARSEIDKNHKVLFKPNNSVALGVGFYIFEVAFEIAFAVPVDDKSSFKYGRSKASDFQINALGKFWGFDVYRQKYSGFYLDDSEVVVSSNQPQIQRADIDTRNFGLAGIYTFNRDKFSLRSSYNFAEQQLFSRGSWFVTSTINSFKIQGDSVLLSIPNREAFSEFAEFIDLRYTTFGIAPGYSHNFIYKKFFVNLTLGIGPAHNWTYFKLANGTERNNVSINSISVARIGVGYNADRFFAGVGFANQSRNLKIEDFRISNSSGIFKLILGYRIKEFGILKKRAVDLIPFKI